MTFSYVSLSYTHLPKRRRSRIMQIMQVNGVLIEGVDYVGKTSVAARLLELIRGEGQSVRPGKCYLRQSPVIDYLEARAKEHWTMIDRDWYYTAAILTDLAAYEPHPEFVVQDRHWLTQLGRNLFFHPNQDLVSKNTIERLHIPFEQ